ncbi:MAG: hypothetical protein MJ252_07480 [archaeon]|nr:hypothetical protein [archaeon]
MKEKMKKRNQVRIFSFNFLSLVIKNISAKAIANSINEKEEEIPKSKPKKILIQIPKEEPKIKVEENKTENKFENLSKRQLKKAKKKQKKKEKKELLLQKAKELSKRFQKEHPPIIVNPIMPSPPEFIRDEEALKKKYETTIDYPSILEQSFKTNSNGEIISYLFQLEPTSNIPSDILDFGLLFPQVVPFQITLPLMIYGNSSYDYKEYKLRFVNQIILQKKDFLKIVLFYLQIIYIFFSNDANYYEKPNESKAEEMIDYLLGRKIKKLCSNQSSKKYLIVPLKSNSSNGELSLNEKILDNCCQISKLNEDYKKNYNLQVLVNNFKVMQKKDPYSDLKSIFLGHPEKIYINDFYKGRAQYKIIDFIFMDDSVDTFFNKISSGDEERKITIKRNCELKSRLGDLKKTEQTAKAKDILFEMSIKPNVFTNFSSLAGFRKKYSSEKDKIIKDKVIAYVEDLNQNYNKHQYLFIKYGYEKTMKATKEEGNKEKKKENIPPKKFNNLVPLRHLLPNFYFFHQRKQIFYFPSLLYTLEYFLTPIKLMNRFGFKIEDDYTKIPKENLFFDKYNYFLWGLTCTSAEQNFSYEHLQSLGSSVMKFLSALFLYESNIKGMLNGNFVVGNLDKTRGFFLSHNYLFEKTKELGFDKHILRKRLQYENYTFPLFENTMETNFVTNPTGHQISECFESILGAIFMHCNDLRPCVKLLKAFSFFQCKKYDNKVKIFKDINTSYKLFMDALPKLNITKYKYPPFKKINYEVTFGEIFSLYNINLFSSEEIKTYEDLQKNCLTYEFKDNHLLVNALTHKSLRNQNGFDYENMEFLGDSILDTYIDASIMNIFGPYLYKLENKKLSEKEFNELPPEEQLLKLKEEKAKVLSDNKKRNFVKFFIGSNNFLAKISILLNLPKFINITPLEEIAYKELIKKERPEILKERVNPMKKDNYTKIIADVFESLIAAIFLDSDLKTVFKFLDRIYGPFISYCAFNLDKIIPSIKDKFLAIFLKARKANPDIKTSLKADRKTYETIITFGGEIICKGKGETKDDSEEDAYNEGLKILERKYEFLV